MFNKVFLEAMLEHFNREGAKIIARVATHQPAAYLKICALLVPRDMKVEHSGGVKAMTDEELDAALMALREMLAARACEAAKVIEGEAESSRGCRRR